MALTTITQRALMAVAFGLLVATIVDVMQVYRPSPLAAVACTAGLLAGKPQAERIVSDHATVIAESAARSDLPPELVAAVILNHQKYHTASQRFTDCFGSALGADLSLGLAQIRLSTAADIDGTPMKEMGPSDYRILRSRLLDPVRNIDYEARELRALLERPHRYPGIDADALIHDPAAMALVISEYRSGRSEAARENSRRSAEAFNALRLIREDTLDRFDRQPKDANDIRASISEYLQFIYCESGIFNASVCQDWQQEHAGLDH